MNHYWRSPSQNMIAIRIKNEGGSIALDDRSADGTVGWAATVPIKVQGELVHEEAMRDGKVSNLFSWLWIVLSKILEDELNPLPTLAPALWKKFVGLIFETFGVLKLYPF